MNPKLAERLRCIVISGLAACIGAPAPAPAAEPGPVHGITKPYRYGILSATVAGTVTAIHVREGDRVEAGQVLLELDRRQEELEVERRRLIADSRAEVDSAAARVATLQAALAGTRRLFETTQSVSREELDKAELEWKLAQAELGRLEIAEERERIEYKMALEQLRRRSLTAPAAGVINRIEIEAGENCDPRQPLLHLVDSSRYYFVASAAATRVADLRVDMPVVIDVPVGRRLAQQRGRICFVSTVVDAASGLQEFKALFDNPEHAVRPGVSAVLQWPGGTSVGERE